MIDKAENDELESHAQDLSSNNYISVSYSEEVQSHYCLNCFYSYDFLKDYLHYPNKLFATTSTQHGVASYESLENALSSLAPAFDLYNSNETLEELAARVPELFDRERNEEAVEILLCAAYSVFLGKRTHKMPLCSRSLRIYRRPSQPPIFEFRSLGQVLNFILVKMMGSQAEPKNQKSSVEAITSGNLHFIVRLARFYFIAGKMALRIITEQHYCLYCRTSRESRDVNINCTDLLSPFYWLSAALECCLAVGPNYEVQNISCPNETTVWSTIAECLDLYCSILRDKLLSPRDLPFSLIVSPESNNGRISAEITLPDNIQEILVKMAAVLISKEVTMCGNGIMRVSELFTRHWLGGPLSVPKCRAAALIWAVYCYFYDFTSATEAKQCALRFAIAQAWNSFGVCIDQQLELSLCDFDTAEKQSDAAVSIHKRESVWDDLNSYISPIECYEYALTLCIGDEDTGRFSLRRYAAPWYNCSRSMCNRANRGDTCKQMINIRGVLYDAKDCLVEAIEAVQGSVSTSRNRRDSHQNENMEESAEQCYAGILDSNIEIPLYLCWCDLGCAVMRFEDSFAEEVQAHCGVHRIVYFDSESERPTAFIRVFDKACSAVTCFANSIEEFCYKNQSFIDYAQRVNKGGLTAVLSSQIYLVLAKYFNNLAVALEDDNGVMLNPLYRCVDFETSATDSNSKTDGRISVNMHQSNVPIIVENQFPVKDIIKATVFVDELLRCSTDGSLKLCYSSVKPEFIPKSVMLRESDRALVEEYLVRRKYTTGSCKGQKQPSLVHKFRVGLVKSLLGVGTVEERTRGALFDPRGREQSTSGFSAIKSSVPCYARICVDPAWYKLWLHPLYTSSTKEEYEKRNSQPVEARFDKELCYRIAIHLSYIVLCAPKDEMGEYSIISSINSSPKTRPSAVMREVYKTDREVSECSKPDIEMQRNMNQIYNVVFMNIASMLRTRSENMRQFETYIDNEANHCIIF